MREIAHDTTGSAEDNDEETKTDNANGLVSGFNLLLGKLCKEMKKEGRVPDLLKFSPADDVAARVVWSVMLDDPEHEPTESVLTELDSLSVTPPDVASINPIQPKCPATQREALKDPAAKG